MTDTVLACIEAKNVLHFYFTFVFHPHFVRYDAETLISFSL